MNPIYCIVLIRLLKNMNIFYTILILYTMIWYAHHIYTLYMSLYTLYNNFIDATIFVLFKIHINSISIQYISV